MALLQNGSIQSQYPLRQTGGLLFCQFDNIGRKTETSRNFSVGEGGFGNKVAIPNGYNHPYAWTLPFKAGGLATTDRSNIIGTGSTSNVNLAGGRNLILLTPLSGVGTISTANIKGLAIILASLIGEGLVTADISAIANRSAELHGLGEVYSADMNALAQAIATILSSGDIASSLEAVISIGAQLDGLGEITPPVLEQIAGMISSMIGSGALTVTAKGQANLGSSLSGEGLITPPVYSLIAGLLSTLTGNGSATLSTGAQPAFMNCEITTFSELSPQSLAKAVMEYNVDGTYTFEQVMKIIAAVQAGKTTITSLGGGAATVEFKDLSDTKSVITADMTGSERTNVTLDV
jgi:hypothetical protein